jgi:hypothetical protein
MSDAQFNPQSRTISQLKQWLTDHDVALPSAKEKKETYVRLVREKQSELQRQAASSSAAAAAAAAPAPGRAWFLADSEAESAADVKARERLNISTAPPSATT